MTAADVHEMGTSPSCLALNAAGTRLYSANETDRVGDKKEGTVSALNVDQATGKLKLLDTVRSGGAGPTFVSIHPSGRYAGVADRFRGSVAALPLLEDGQLALRPMSRLTRAMSARPRRPTLRRAVSPSAATTALTSAT